MPTTTTHRPGRPPSLDEVKRAEICALVASGCSYRSAAKYVGCTVQAISALAKRDAEFAGQLDKAVAQREAILLSHLRESSRRSWRAAAWLLEKTVGGQYGGKVPTLDEEAERELADEMCAQVRAAMQTSGGRHHSPPSDEKAELDRQEESVSGEDTTEQPRAASAPAASVPTAAKTNTAAAHAADLAPRNGKIANPRPHAENPAGDAKNWSASSAEIVNEKVAAQHSPFAKAAAKAAAKTKHPTPATAIPPPPYANETFGCTQFSGPRINKPNLRPPDATKTATADSIRESMKALEQAWRIRDALDDD